MVFSLCKYPGYLMGIQIPAYVTSFIIWGKLNNSSFSNLFMCKMGENIVCIHQCLKRWLEPCMWNTWLRHLVEIQQKWVIIFSDWILPRIVIEYSWHKLLPRFNVKFLVKETDLIMCPVVRLLEKLSFKQLTEGLKQAETMPWIWKKRKILFIKFCIFFS